MSDYAAVFYFKGGGTESRMFDLRSKPRGCDMNLIGLYRQERLSEQMLFPLC